MKQTRDKDVRRVNYTFHSTNTLKIPGILIFMLFALVGCSTTLTTSSDKSEEDLLDIYLLIGQSNMAGRAEIEDQDKDTLEGVFLFKGMEGDEWERAANPLNKYSSIRKKLSMQRLNPGYTFSREMARYSDRPIGLVVNARGGTSINAWGPGSEYYQEAVHRTKDAIKSGDLKGILWHQGESDVSRYDAYLPKVTALIEAFRIEFNRPDLPFIVGQLSEDKEPRIKFNEMILKLPELMEQTGVVTTENTSTTDSTHFDTRSQRLLGERYALEMMKILTENKR